MSKKKVLSFSQFIKRFPNEEACYEYLYKIKWPNGFECPVCGHRHCYPMHLQMYLSEFCYRFNRHLFGGAIFDRLLIAIAG